MLGPITRAAVAVAVGVLGVLPGLVSAQDLERSRHIASSDVLSQISMFTYQERRTSDLILRATPVLSAGRGEAEVRYQDGNADIAAEVSRMPPPASLGPFTTYVLWALTPDGRASNQGVLTGPDGGRGEVETQHPTSQFALIVTAEPHFAVSAPSTMVVMYNVPDRIRGVETKISSLFERADYSSLAPGELNDRPVEILQAEYSIEIAKSAGAEEFVPNMLYAAAAKLDAALVAWSSRRRNDRRIAPGVAREAVIAGEDARRAALVARVEADAKAEREAAAAAAAAAERELAETAAAEAALRAQATAEEAARLAAAQVAARMQAERRAELLNRLSTVLPTRDTERGLVSEIGGVQFATGTADLNPPARESLARFSGIVGAYPELRFSIEGHTDNVGADGMNMDLSLRRAISVRDYLTGLGVPLVNIEVQGFGPARPVADNAVAAGRARNRRVEIVISGGMLVAGTQ